MASPYWGELRTHWKPLLAATLGLGVGVGLNAYTAGLFAPKLIAEFGWSRAQFALIGSFALLMIVLQPITGRLTDRFGVRTVAMAGVLASPIPYAALSFQSGDIRIFFAITLMQVVIGTLTTTPVYSRIVAERFNRARGLAFSIVMTGPPLAGALLVPVLGAVIEAEGWRATCLVLAFVSLVFGSVAVALAPKGLPHAKMTAEPVELEPVAFPPVIGGPAPATPAQALLRMPAFWVLMAAMVLVNVPQSLFSHQIKLVLIDSGASAQAATWLISAFAIGVVVGRFACGVTLDRYRPYLVAAVALGVPAIGMVMLASPIDATAVLLLSVVVLGLAQGAEGDIAAYLVSRRFGLGVFSLVLGFVGAATAAGLAIGSLLLSLTLKWWDSYTPFLLLCAVLTLIGAALFLTLGRDPEAAA